MLRDAELVAILRYDRRRFGGTIRPAVCRRLRKRFRRTWPDRSTSRRLTEQAFQNYLAVMMVALVALFPDISTTTFGIVSLIATASWSVWVVIRLYQTIRQHEKPSARSIRRHVTSVIGFGLLLVSALCMAFHWVETFHLFAASMLVLLFSATAVSWELLKQIANRTPVK